MKKIPAYTVLEILIVISITGFVLTLIIGIYSNINQFITSIKSTTEASYEISRFYSTLRKDFEQAKTIKGNNREIIINGSDYFADYTFTDKKVIFTKKPDIDFTDTFHINTGNMHIEYISKNSRIIKKLEFEIQFAKMIIPVNLFKEYTDLFYYKQNIE